MQEARENSPIRAVVVDFGEVLSRSGLARMTALFGVGPAEFKTYYLLFVDDRELNVQAV